MLNKAQDDDLVMNLVELALARPAGERQASLLSACEGDTELFDQAWKYVQWEQSMNGFLLDPLYPSRSCDQLFEPGELLDGRFRIVREVAQGGMGVVYEAVDEKLNRPAAIKGAKVGFGKRLPHEVRNATKISHANVCKTFEIHTAATKHGEIDFLTMEFIEGETLAERLRREPPTTKEALTIARQLCAGLAEAHHNQVIHGDLKSNNVILSTGGDGQIRAVITDFGLASGLEAAHQGAESEELRGTPRYMAPELWKGERPSLPSDLYALGVILSECSRSGSHICRRCIGWSRCKKNVRFGNYSPCTASWTVFVRAVSIRTQREDLQMLMNSCKLSWCPVCASGFWRQWRL
jgi:serine/threonine protein kinase